MTRTEQIVAELCKGTFLSFWSFPNPIGKSIDKELCDILVVCEPDVIIFSIKEINVKESGQPIVEIERWERNAIQKSVKQIYGAERYIRDKQEVLLSDRLTKIKLPDTGIRNVYRVAVTFGRGEKFPSKEGDFGNGYVHVFDERSIEIVLKELDTISDFIDYLNAKEAFQRSPQKVISFSGEDLLAMYLQNGLQLPKNTDIFIIADEIWPGYAASTEYAEEKEANRISYVWDGVIEGLTKDFHEGQLIENISISELELALRWMNKENRYQRRLLSHAFVGMFNQSQEERKKISRIVLTENIDDPLYVFMSRPLEHRDTAREELNLRCVVARSLYPEKERIIGIASEPEAPDKGHSIDLVYMHLTGWDEEMQLRAKSIQDELGYFKGMVKRKIKEDGTTVND